MESKASQFRRMLRSGGLSFICEAHNGLSARIVEEAGFEGIWGSGLALSAQYGVRDNNEASWTQVLDMLEFMSDATRIPILLDGDTGYGNFNNVRRLVKKLEQREIAAVCIEDKLFPKTNSFVQGQAQPLANLDEFCGKIKAGKDVQCDDDFSIVARVEAFIAGWGLSEALHRAEAYHEAGADAILIHSGQSVPDEVLAFKREWGDRCPVVIIPTKYFTTPTRVFEEHGFSLVIWANHLLRASITAMQGAARSLMQNRTLIAVEDHIAPVPEVFRLQGTEELLEAEKRYLPWHIWSVQALVLAASRGVALGDLTRDRPKAMVELAGKPLLAHIVDAYNAIGIKKITVVRGYRKEAINLPNLHWVDNDAFAETGELVSMIEGLESLSADDGIIVSYGDVVLNECSLQILSQSSDDLAVLMDSNWRDELHRRRQTYYVHCTSRQTGHAYSSRVLVEEIDPQMDAKRWDGVWTGFFKISGPMMATVLELAHSITEQRGRRTASLPDLINGLINSGREVRALYATGYWLDIDSPDDLVRASSFQGAL